MTAAKIGIRCSVRPCNTTKKRLPATAGRAVWEKVTKGRAGIDAVHREFRGVQDRNKKNRNDGETSAKK